MFQFKPSADKKKLPFTTDKKDTSRYDNVESGDLNQYAMRLHHDRNDNMNAQLLSNYNQIKDMLKERKGLLERKAESMIRKNREKVDSIQHARPQDLKNQAKILNDRSVFNLIEHASEMNEFGNILKKIADVKDIGGFDTRNRAQGKQFWDNHKEIEKEMKKKAEVYTIKSRELKSINQKERAIFNEIEKFETEMIAHLTRERKHPDHIKRAEKCNEEIDRRKGMLRELKIEKDKMKQVIQNIIEQILEFNEKNETVLKRRHKELDEMFGGCESLPEFDEFMNSLQIVIDSKSKDEKTNQQSINHFQRQIKDYDLIIEQIEKFKEEEDQIFHMISDELKENIKTAILEKAYFSGIPQNVSQDDLLRKCRGYRKLLADLSEERPKIDLTINKMGQMNSMLYPIKKAYSTEDTRREELKRELKKLYQNNVELERNMKKIRDFAFEMEAQSRRRQAIEIELNDYAEKGNLTEYKMKVRELENLNKQIEASRDFATSGEVGNMEQSLVSEVEKLYEKYEDILEELEVNDQNVNLGTYLSKLEKRISLI